MGKKIDIAALKLRAPCTLCRLGQMLTGMFACHLCDQPVA
jgi:hypothetical protein